MSVGVVFTSVSLKFAYNSKRDTSGVKIKTQRICPYQHKYIEETIYHISCICKSS